MNLELINKLERFIPTTTERDIGNNIVFRPVRSWHSNTFAGERLEHPPDSEDRSGCMRKINGIRMCPIPYTVTHRIYWHKKNPNFTISAFLSYPDAMGISDEYFWEIHPYKDDIKRFHGPNAEKKMETTIKRMLSYRAKKK